jgi:hypothetical protein
MNKKDFWSETPPVLEQTHIETDHHFDSKYHVLNNPGAAKRDQIRPCKVCGWSINLAIHDEGNFGTVEGWAHPYQP